MNPSGAPPSGRLGLRCPAAAIAVLLAGCGAGRTYISTPGPYDIVPGAWEEELEAARDAFEEGDLQECETQLAPLAEERPIVLPVRVFLQDVQLGLLGASREVGGVRVPPERAQVHLGDLYAARADANPSASGYVLAARLADSGEAALDYLSQAAALDSGCVWVPYGRAWWLFRLRRFPEAREAIQDALDLDGGHLPTMRLHGSMLASAGDTKDAVYVLELWLERGADDPLVDPRMRADAKVDLAALLVLEDEAEEALDLLAGIRPDLLPDPARAELVRAAALEDLGLRTLALSAARRAKALDPDGLLSLVQQALLLHFEGNTAQERAMWEMLLLEAESRLEPRGELREASLDQREALDVQSILIQLQARARIERIDSERAERAPEV